MIDAKRILALMTPLVAFALLGGCGDSSGEPAVAPNPPSQEDGTGSAGSDRTADRNRPSQPVGDKARNSANAGERGARRPRGSDVGEPRRFHKLPEGAVSDPQEIRRIVKEVARGRGGKRSRRDPVEEIVGILDGDKDRAESDPHSGSNGDVEAILDEVVSGGP